MTRRRPLWRWTSGPGLLAALLVVVLQTLVPQGVMPAADHGPTLVICTGHGPLPAAPDGPASPAPHHHAGAACPFAHHGLTGAASVAPSLAVASAVFATTWSDRSARAIQPPFAAPPPPSHAPPTSRPA